MIVEKKDKFNMLSEYLVLVLSTAFIWCVALAAHHIFPFGTNMMDIGDMGEQCVPVYTFLWDVLHGEEVLFFDWSTGLGNNMCGAIWHFGLISPFNVFFVFIRRDWIEASMAFYILIKLICISLSMRYVLEKWFPALPKVVECSFCLLYTFSAFTMEYYYAPMWLELVFMFPLIMYFYFKLLEKKEKTGYIICLALMCMMSFQHIYMLILFLLFLTGILMLVGKKKYQNSLWILLKGTVVGLLLAAWVWLPGVLQIGQANRLGHNNSLSDIYCSIWIFYPDKWMKLINMGIPLSFFALYLRKNLRNRKNIFFIYIVGILSAPILLESSNLLWHGGSYEGYTMRFSYMLAFWLVVTGAFGYANIKQNEGVKTDKTNTLLWNVLTGISCAGMFLAAALQAWWLKGTITIVQIISSVFLMMIVSIILFSLNAFIYRKLVLLVVILQSVFLGISAIQVSWNLKDSFAAESNMIYREDKEDDPLLRTKSLDILLTHNYPLIMGKNAMSNYLAVVSPQQIETVLDLGYAKVGDRMSDYGGTLFSDALLGISDAIAREIPNEDLYALRDFWKAHEFYDSKYTYSIGILVKDILKMETPDERNPLSWQNQLSKAVTGKELLEIEYAEGDRVSVTANEKSILYLYSEQGNRIQSITIKNRVTGESREIAMHQSGWQNGILELGTYENAVLDIMVDSEEEIEKISAATLPLAEFEENLPAYGEDVRYAYGTHSLFIDLKNSSEGEYLFLPVYADKGWKCKVNGRKVEIENFAGYCMAIPLEFGENRIELIFYPVGWWPGVFASMAGMLCLIWVILKNRKEKSYMSSLNRILWGMGETLHVLLFVAFYVIPVMYLMHFLFKF